LVVLALLIALPTGANYIGVRGGGEFSSLLVLAKLLPLVILITLGLTRAVLSETPAHPFQEGTSNGSGWISALLLLTFTYGGYEDAMAPAGEVKDPRRTMGFALGMGLLACTLLYTLLQLVTVATIGLSNSARPLAEVASVLIGVHGATFVSVAAMLSTYGNVSAGVLTVPRLAYSLAAHGDFPSILGKLHPRFNTPAISIIGFSVLVWVLAETGTFLWALVLSAGSMMVVYAGTCGALIRLRQLRPRADALRVPFGPALATIGILIACALLTQLRRSEWLLMSVTFAVGAANWWWVKGPGRTESVAPQH
jgi:basic amino acid/polyamine antiporter, APA family